MEILVVIFLALVFGICVYLFQKNQNRIQGLPPGPFRFPGVGCLFQILLLDYKYPFVALHKLSKTYGDIVYVQFGVVPGVAINGYEALYEMYRNDDWIGRMDDRFLINRTFDKPLGLITGSVDVWKESRRFSMRVLRDLGFGVKKSMETLIQEELEELSSFFIQKIGNNNGAVTFKNIFHAPMLNVTWSMVTGTRFNYDDPKLNTLFEKIEDYFKSGSFGANLLTSYPFLTEWAPSLVGFDKQSKANKNIQEYLQKILTETRELGQYIDNPTNFMEVFLRKIESRKKDGTNDDVVYSEENLIALLYDFLLAGTETASNVLAFGILYICLNQKVQKKVHDEIDTVIGASKIPKLADRDKMIYCEATILEIFRLSNVAPISPRRLYKDTTIRNYKLKKGTTVFVNIWSASMDEKFWGDPHVFRPERFLNSVGDKIINADRILPFGAGKRNCSGESVAKSTIFILFVGLLQRFNIAVSPGEKIPTMDPVLGFTLSPEPFTTIMSLRH